jgi:general secretion pathway protein H
MQVTPTGCFNLSTGFTLVELIVVVALISLLLFIAMPRFQDTVLSDARRKMANWIMFKTQSLREKAIRDQVDYVLHVDIDNQHMWTSIENQAEESLEHSAKKGYELKQNLKIIDVEHQQQGKITSGTADILFYSRGYADRAFIHVEENDEKQLSFLVETFLPEVKMYEEYRSFED